MSGTFNKVYTFSAPLRIPTFVKVDFIFGGTIRGTVTKIIDAYGPQNFVWYMDSALPGNAGVVLAGMTTVLYFQVGDTWTTSLLARVAPPVFNFPFAFSGYKLGWR